MWVGGREGWEREWDGATARDFGVCLRRGAPREAWKVWSGTAKAFFGL